MMQNNSEISVTLSGELINHLRSQAQQLHVPLKWLVASLVVDTSETASDVAVTDDRTSILQCSVERAVCPA
jgi:hypothetical protein